MTRYACGPRVWAGVLLVVVKFTSHLFARQMPQKTQSSPREPTPQILRKSLFHEPGGAGQGGRVGGIPGIQAGVIPPALIRCTPFQPRIGPTRAIDMDLVD